jgi:hypothetical protein
MVKASMEESLKPLGLQLAADGKISERPFLHTLRQTFVRDQRALKIFDVSRPAHPCFGIDHARISGARDFTQGGITLGACYKSGDLLSEQMHVTLCIGLHHDDGKGLSAMLGPKEASGDRPAVVGIGPEFVQLADSKELEMADGSCVPCEPVICLDLAAFRGITQKRGKCSAICACRGLKSLQSYPGNDGIPDLPVGSTVDDFHAAQAIARSQCGYGTPLLELPSLMAATHRLGPGEFCPWCEKVPFATADDRLAAEVKLAALRARVTHGEKDSEDRKEASKELNQILKDHAESHGDALLLEPLILANKSGTQVFIVDPMHCLELNLMKTLWKYSFGDRMTDSDRELVAQYLSSIGLHLDIRNKGQRDPGQKWFSATQADEFVLGSDHFKKSKSPGLVKNILAIVEIIFDKRTVADSFEQEAAPPKKAKTARADRHKAGGAGPRFGGAEVGPGAAGTSGLSISGLRGDEDSNSTILEYVRSRYGNHASTVIAILTAWEAYGALFMEWREPWESDTDAYRAKRAFQFARCARDFQQALVSLSNYKHKSWYVHLVVWVVWQQIWMFGNLWPMSTISIESRNARTEKIGLRFANWRPMSEGPTQYSYVDRRSGEQVSRTQSYNSSPVHQMLKRVALAELLWHGSHRFSSPDMLRLRTQLRSKALKVEVADAPPSLPPATLRAELLGKS